MVLTKEELMTIDGGGLSWSTILVGGSIILSFLSGFFKGFL